MRVALIVFASFVSSLAATAAPPLPDGWAVYPTPTQGACEWSRANLSKHAWRVRLEGERVRIEPTSTPLPVRSDTPKFDIPLELRERLEGPCDDCIVRVSDGWLVGFNVGEWGGRLWWTDANGRGAYPVEYAGRCTDIADTGPLLSSETPGGKGGNLFNIVSLYPRAHRVFAFAGLAHLGPSDGDINRIERRDGRWQACMVRNLEGAPEATVADDQDSWFALVAGGIVPERHGALIRVRTDGTLKQLAQPSFVALGTGLYANSMVKLADGTLYVGMRHFVARLIPTADGTYRDELLLPSNRPPFDFEPSIDDPNYPYGGTPPNCPRRR